MAALSIASVGAAAPCSGVMATAPVDGNINLSSVGRLSIACVGKAASCCGVMAAVSVDGNTNLSYVGRLSILCLIRFPVVVVMAHASVYGNINLSYVGGLSIVAIGAAAPCCWVTATGVVGVFVYTANAQ